MKLILVAGAPAVGKTAVLLKTLPHLMKRGKKLAVSKMDCLKSQDEAAYNQLHIPVITGLSQDLCPDHFLVTNLMGLFGWGQKNDSQILIIETAGLCNRCAPFVKGALNVCVVDATASIKSPEKLGPMVTTANLLILTKTDMISQAEREILASHLAKLTGHEQMLSVNGLTGAGSKRFADVIYQAPNLDTLEGAHLKHTMPAAICSYCVGETRIGEAYHQGMVSLMDFDGERKEP